jgi:hypothetical protein
MSVNMKVTTPVGSALDDSALTPAEASRPQDIRTERPHGRPCWPMHRTTTAPSLAARLSIGGSICGSEV